MGTIVGRGRRASQDEEDKSKIFSHFLLNFEFLYEFGFFMNLNVLIVSMYISFLHLSLTTDSKLEFPIPAIP